MPTMTPTVTRKKKPPGSTVTLTSTPAANTYVWAWGLPGCLYYLSTCAVTMSADVSANVTLALKPTVTVTVNGAGSVALTAGTSYLSCNSSCTYPIDPQVAVIQLTAIGASGNYFTTWGGDCGGTVNFCQLLTSASHQVTADFAADPTLTVTLSGSGHGSVASSDGVLSCPGTCLDPVTPGTSITLTATAAANSVFSGWSGACSGSLPTCTLTTNVSIAAAAAFTASSASSGGGSSSGGGGGSSGGGGGSSGGGGALDLLSLAALTCLAAASRRSRVIAARRAYHGLRWRGWRYRQIVEPPCRIFYRHDRDRVYMLYVMRGERKLRKSELSERDPRK